MIKFETSRFGILEVNEDRIISFPDGIPGFPDIKRYILMDYKDTPLKWLQAVDHPDVAFIVTEPSTISSGYSIKLDDVIKQYLQLEDDNDLAVLVIIRVEGGRVIANLNGPLLINASLMKGLQVILENN